MKIELEVSNSSTLELKSGAIYSIRENHRGALAIVSRHKDDIEVSAKQGAEQNHTALGNYYEITLS